MSKIWFEPVICIKGVDLTTGLPTWTKYQLYKAADGSFYRMDCVTVWPDGKFVKYGVWFDITELPAAPEWTGYVDCEVDVEKETWCVLRDVDGLPTRVVFCIWNLVHVQDNGTLVIAPTTLDPLGQPFTLAADETPDLCPEAKAYEVDCIYSAAAGGTVTIPGLIHNDLCITLANDAPGQPVTEDLEGVYNGAPYVIPASKFCPDHKITAQSNNCLFGLWDVVFTVPAGHSLCISGTKIESGTGNAKVKTKAAAEKTAE